MKLSEWASIAEITSGIAVVVTLIFLVVGINQNTNMTRALVYDRNIDSVNDVRRTVVQDAELAELMAVYFDADADGFDGLDRGGQTRIIVQVSMVFSGYEKAYFARQYGVLGSAEWERFASAICRALDRIEQIPRLYVGVTNDLTDDFIAEMNRDCRNGEYVRIE